MSTWRERKLRPDQTATTTPATLTVYHRLISKVAPRGTKRSIDRIPLARLEMKEERNDLAVCFAKHELFLLHDERWKS